MMLMTFMVVILLGSLVPLRADEEGSVPVSLTVSFEGDASERGTAEGVLGTVVRGSVEVALLKRNFIAVEEALESPAGNAVTDFEMAVAYTMVSDRVVLTFTLADRSGGMRTQSGTLECGFDLDFDQTVGAYVQTLLVAAQSELSGHPPVPRTETPDRALPAVFDATAFSMPVASYGPSPDVVIAPEKPRPAQVLPPLATVPTPEEARSPETVPSRVVAPPSETALDPGTPEIALVADAIRERVRRPASGVGAGIGGFIPLGRAGEYFKIAAQFQASLDFPLDESDRWRAGFSASLLPVSIEGRDTASASSLFATLSGEATRRFSSIGSMTPYLRAAAGPAVASIRGDGATSYTELMPFASASLGAAIRVFGRMGIDLEVSSILFVDTGGGSVAALWGMLPRLVITMEI